MLMKDKIKRLEGQNTKLKVKLSAKQRKLENLRTKMGETFLTLSEKATKINEELVGFRGVVDRFVRPAYQGRYLLVVNELLPEFLDPLYDIVDSYFATQGSVPSSGGLAPGTEIKSSPVGAGPFLEGMIGGSEVF